MSEQKTCLTDGSPVTEDHTEIDPNTGMQKGYVVLAPEERAKGYVRPLRTTYVHRGIRPKHPTRELTAEEQERYKDFGYVLFEQYPEDEACTGRFWTQDQLGSGCGTPTRMSMAIAETYARDPNFYGATFCCGCGKHLHLEEFVWQGTDEQVGS